MEFEARTAKTLQELSSRVTHMFSGGVPFVLRADNISSLSTRHTLTSCVCYYFNYCYGTVGVCELIILEVEATRTFEDTFVDTFVLSKVLYFRTYSYESTPSLAVKATREQ